MFALRDELIMMAVFAVIGTGTKKMDEIILRIQKEMTNINDSSHFQGRVGYDRVRIMWKNKHGTSTFLDGHAGAKSAHAR
jgi:hypothetical protein